MALLLVHLAATAALAGLGWVVQRVVYPAFRVVGTTGERAAWRAVHAAHTRAITPVVGVPWLVQGLALAALLLRDGLSPLLVLTGVLALVPVVVTVGVSVPLHRRLDGPYDDAAARRLITTNWLRTGSWTAGTACAALLAGQGVP